jgi:hypothetical protein
MPTRPFTEAGEVIEPSVSVPTATAARLDATAAAPARGRARRADVRPLGEVRLAEDHGSRGAQLLDHERIARRLHVDERERARGGLHAVGRRDVVLHQHGNAVQRAARPRALAFLVERGRDGERIRIQLDHGIDARAGLVDRLDAREIEGRELLRADAALRHGLLELRDGSLDDVERRLGRLLGRAGRGHGRQRDEEEGKPAHRVTRGM